MAEMVFLRYSSYSLCYKYIDKAQRAFWRENTSRSLTIQKRDKKNKKLATLPTANSKPILHFPAKDLLCIVCT
jgi:hypothetical protein